MLKREILILEKDKCLACLNASTSLIWAFEFFVFTTSPLGVVVWSLPIVDKHMLIKKLLVQLEKLALGSL